MKKIQADFIALSNEAIEIVTGSEIQIFQNDEGVFFMGIDRSDTPQKIGDIEALDEAIKELNASWNE